MDYEQLSTTETFDRNDFSRTNVDGQFRWVASRNFTVRVKHDTVNEPIERFSARLAFVGPSQPYLLQGDMTATVTDNGRYRVAGGPEDDGEQQQQRSRTGRRDYVQLVAEQQRTGFNDEHSPHRNTGCGRDLCLCRRFHAFKRPVQELRPHCHVLARDGKPQ